MTMTVLDHRDDAVDDRPITDLETAASVFVTARPRLFGIAFRILGGITQLRNACVVLRQKCVDGITANPARMRFFVEHSIGIITALVPILGYETCTRIAKEALETGGSVYQIIIDRGLMTRAEVDHALNPDAMVAPRVTGENVVVEG